MPWFRAGYFLAVDQHVLALQHQVVDLHRQVDDQVRDVLVDMVGDRRVDILEGVGVDLHVFGRDEAHDDVDPVEQQLFEVRRSLRA